LASLLDHAQYLSSEAGSVATGACQPGYVGNPIRNCTLTGDWSETLGDPCIGTLFFFLFDLFSIPFSHIELF